MRCELVLAPTGIFSTSRSSPGRPVADAAKTLSTLLSVDQSGTLAHIKMPVADPDPEEVERE